MPGRSTDVMIQRHSGLQGGSNNVSGSTGTGIKLNQYRMFKIKKILKNI